MNESNQVVCHESAPAVARQGQVRPSYMYAWADLKGAPLHGFPIRDEILHQYAFFSPDDEVMEIGPGSGFTAYYLSRQVRRMILVDFAEEPLSEIRSQLGNVPNVGFVRGNLAEPGLAERAGNDFSLVFGLDVFEYVRRPDVCLQNLAACLRPGGRLFLTYPNVPPPKGDGVTWFVRVEDLEELLRQAGFRDWEIFAVRMRPCAATVYALLHEWPLRIYRCLRRGNPRALPQTYESTWAFQHRAVLRRYGSLLHFWLIVLGLLLRCGGDVFATEPLKESPLGQQLVIRARR